MGVEPVDVDLGEHREAARWGVRSVSTSVSSRRHACALACGAAHVAPYLSANARISAAEPGS